MPAAPSFRIAGIPVRVELAFFVIIGVLGLAYAEPLLILTGIGIAFVSVLLHELGHAVAFRAFGSQPRITLHGFGGLTHGAGDLGPGRDIVVSLAGPLAVLVLIGLPALWVSSNDLVTGETGELILQQVVFINVGWSLLNLVPVLPLDGGAVTASVLELVLGPRGRRVANVVSIVAAAALGLWGLSQGLLFAALLAAMFGALNVRELGEDRRRSTATDLGAAQQALLHGQPHLADQLIRRARQSRLSAAEATWARELDAWARLGAGDVGPAASWVAEAGRRPAVGPAPANAAAAQWMADPGPSASLRAALALAQGRTGEGATTASWALLHDPRRAARPLLALTVWRAGVLEAVVDDLVALGDEGVPALALLRQSLVAADAVDAAMWVSRRVAAGPAT